MVAITFPDRETEKRALGFLFGRFSGKVLNTESIWFPKPPSKLLRVRISHSW
jgi:hypothetical protein